MKTPIGTLQPEIKTVHIWGGGVSGLLMAHFLSRQGYQIELYEKSDRLGGKIHSEKFSDGVIESGANAVFATQEIETWLKELGLTPIHATEKLKRRIWLKGKPASPVSLKLLLQVLPRLTKSTPPIHDNTTVADFFRPLLGDYVENLLSPALQGIYGSSAKELTVTSLWPELKTGSYFSVIKSLKGPRARSVSFADGMEAFIQALAKSINGRVHLNHQGPFELKTNTIICTEAYTAAELLQTSWPEGSQALHGIEYLTLSNVNVQLKTPTEAQGTFGYLFPRESQVDALGVLFNQEIFPHRRGINFIMPGADNLVARVQNLLHKLGWSSGEIKTFSWTRALPRYNAKRVQALHTIIHDPARPAELTLFGNYVAGISLRDMILTAKRFAESH